MYIISTLSVQIFRLRVTLKFYLRFSTATKKSLFSVFQTWRSVCCWSCWAAFYVSCFDDAKETDCTDIF